MPRRHPLAHLAVAVSLGAAAAAAAVPATRPSTRPVRPRPPVTLHVGDAAPAVHVAKWLKGVPAPSVTDGRVHVVEFWATWCGWCVEDMPHLSALAAKYGDRVQITSVNIWEASHDGQAAMGYHGADPRVPPAARAEAFVRRAGDMMAYTVAEDDAAGTMGTTWCRAAGLYGIPAAFVVDGRGTIVWIGNPGLGMEQVLDAVLAGRYDAAGARAIEADLAAKDASYPGLDKRRRQLFGAGRWVEALAANDALLDAAPSLSADCCSARYAILTHTDPAAAARFGQDVLARSANAPSILAGLGDSIVRDTRNFAIAGRPDYPLALRLLDRSRVCIEPRWSTEADLATAYFNTGDAADAVKWQAAAVEKIDVLLGKVPATAKLVADAHRRLDQYRAAAAAAAAAPAAAAAAN